MHNAIESVGLADAVGAEYARSAFGRVVLFEQMLESSVFVVASLLRPVNRYYLAAAGQFISAGFAYLGFMNRHRLAINLIRKRSTCSAINLIQKDVVLSQKMNL